MIMELAIAWKLALAAGLGGVVGWERELHERPAGLRTHSLVCMGAALITVISISFTGSTSDPGRIAAQIVSGIGFLGAGTILRQGNIVRGLTTAASLWTVAGIGMAVGVGGSYAWLGVVATLIVFVTLSTMSRFEYALGMKNLRQLTLEVRGEEFQPLGSVLERLLAQGVTIRSMKMEKAEEADKRVLRLRLSAQRQVSEKTISVLLAEQPGVVRFEWM